MRVAVLGTGMVGQALAGKLAELGHEVVVGTRDPEATLARSEPDSLGNPPFGVWLEAHPLVALGTPAEAVTAAELIVNATNGVGSVAMLESAGEESNTYSNWFAATRAGPSPATPARRRRRHGNPLEGRRHGSDPLDPRAGVTAERETRSTPRGRG